MDEGHILTQDRTGETQQFNVMTVSLAVVNNVERDFENYLKMSEVAANLKKYVKNTVTAVPIQSIAGTVPSILPIDGS